MKGGFAQWLSGKESACNAGAAGDAGSIPGSGRSPGGGRINPLQHSCLENPMDRGAWWAIVHRITKSETQLKQLSMHACRVGSTWLQGGQAVSQSLWWVLQDSPPTLLQAQVPAPLAGYMTHSQGRGRHINPRGDSPFSPLPSFLLTHTSDMI